MSLYLRKKIRFAQLGTETRLLAPKRPAGPVKCPARAPGEPRPKRPKLTAEQRAAQVARRVPTIVPVAYDPGCDVTAGRRTYTVKTWTRAERYQWRMALESAGLPADAATACDATYQWVHRDTGEPADRFAQDAVPFRLYPGMRGYCAKWDALWPDGRPETVSYSVSATESQHRTLTTCAATVAVTFGEMTVARTGQGCGPDKVRASNRPAKPKRHSADSDLKMSWCPADRVDTRPVADLPVVDGPVALNYVQPGTGMVRG